MIKRQSKKTKNQRYFPFRITARHTIRRANGCSGNLSLTLQQPLSCSSSRFSFPTFTQNHYLKRLCWNPRYQNANPSRLTSQSQLFVRRSIRGPQAMLHQDGRLFQWITKNGSMRRLLPDLGLRRKRIVRHIAQNAIRFRDFSRPWKPLAPHREPEDGVDPHRSL
jgi:hypothetical protein